MKKQLCLIKNGFIVFQNILLDDHTLLHAFEPIFVTLFPLRLRYLQNVVFKRSNNFFWRRKSLSTQLILHNFITSSHKEIKRSHWMLNQDCTDDLSIRHFGRSNRQLFGEMCESSHCLDEELFFITRGCFFRI